MLLTEKLKKTNLLNSTLNKGESKMRGKFKKKIFLYLPQKEDKTILLNFCVTVKVLDTLQSVSGFQEIFIKISPEKKGFIFSLFKVLSVNSLKKELNKKGLSSFLLGESKGEEVNKKLEEISSWKNI
ncbi:MAG: hypothetical protein WC414_02955 [Patescibacteria group bacterium]